MILPVKLQDAIDSCSDLEEARMRAQQAIGKIDEQAWFIRVTDLVLWSSPLHAYSTLESS